MTIPSRICRSCGGQKVSAYARVCHLCGAADESTLTTEPLTGVTETSTESLPPSQSSASFCTACGSSLPENCRRCSSCGASVVGGSPVHQDDHSAIEDGGQNLAGDQEQSGRRMPDQRVGTILMDSKWLRKVAAVQIIGGFLGALASIYSLGFAIYQAQGFGPFVISFGPFYLSLPIPLAFVVGLFLSVLAIIAGRRLWRHEPRGVRLSLWAQALQIPQFSFFGLSYAFIAGLFLLPTVGPSGFSLDFGLGGEVNIMGDGGILSLFKVVLQNPSSGSSPDLPRQLSNFVGLNLIPVALFVYLTLQVSEDIPSHRSGWWVRRRYDLFEADRLPRLKYFLYSLIYLFLFSTIITMVGIEYLGLASILAIILWIWFLVRRRLHDCGRSGWGWWFLIFLPMFYIVVLLLLFVWRGDPNANKYGLPN